MVTFLHAADIHLDSPLRNLATREGAPVELIRNATRRAFENLVQLAVDEKVDFLLLAGDLYDGAWRDFNTGLFFIEKMRRLKEAGIRVFLISGNHDAASRITRALRLPDNVVHFSSRRARTIELEDLNVAIHGQSYAKRAVTADLAKDYPPPVQGMVNIGLLHTALAGRDGHEPYAPCTPGELADKGYDYWALGHVHQREIVDKDPWIVFAGNLQGRHIRETGPRG
ncbi:MAG TPA: DNA repair exonuclease, partial [Desulfobulbaceae bacterium]|nr:DNA repair exonuclease [Desulfobulbaceae bacterium]